MLAYNPIDRFLHKLVLEAKPIAELSFDIDQRLVGGYASDVVDLRHVFVSGLARAGTTALMRQFHASGEFRSLTYRDMPFVLAPSLWLRFAAKSKRQLAKVERAHGDGILVDADSPESLDEVFWRVFAGSDYITKSHLVPHEPLPEIIDKFRGYVHAILVARKTRGGRYLSKNNNNVLRLPAIRKAFPNALILVPFRDPVEHASSLLRQHRRFSEAQASDEFTLSYMTWLAHHEFGLDHRPFRFTGSGSFTASIYDPNEIDYWLEVWRDTYRWLETSAPEDAVFVCYEDLCADRAIWSRLADLAGVDGGRDTDEPFRRGGRAETTASSPGLLAQCSEVYQRLLSRSRMSLCRA